MQTTYNDRPAAGFAGDLASTRFSQHTCRLAEVAIVAPGLVVCEGTTKPGVDPQIHPGQAKIPTSEALVTAALGFVRRKLSQEGSGAAIGDALDIMTEGEIWVNSETAVTYDGAVFVRVTAAGAEVAGSVRADIDGGDAFVLPGAKFKMATTGAGLTKIYYRRPA